MLFPGTQQGIVQMNWVELHKQSEDQLTLTRGYNPPCWDGSPHHGQTFVSFRTCRNKSAQISGAAIALSINGPYLWQQLPKRYLIPRAMNTFTMIISNDVMPKLM